MRSVAIIPARGGSKRIPNKNIRNFLGAPMVSYPLLRAIESKLFSRIIVSTDNPLVGQVAKHYGADVRQRPNYLATDHTTLMEVMTFEAERLSDCETEICFILATALFFTVADLKKGKKLLIKPGITFSLPSQAFAAPIERGYFMDSDQRTRMLSPEKYAKRSQDCQRVYHDSGQFYWGRAKDWINPPNNFFGKHTASFELENRLSIDIDNPADWELAERIYPALMN